VLPCQGRLAPCPAALLQLAWRGYGSTAGASILEVSAAAALTWLPLPAVRTAAGRGVPLLAGHRLRLVLTLTTPPLEVALWTSVAWAVWSARRWARSPGLRRTIAYQLTLGRVRLTLGPADFAGLVGLLQAAQAQPALRPHLSQLAYVYGRM